MIRLGLVVLNELSEIERLAARVDSPTREAGVHERSRAEREVLGDSTHILVTTSDVVFHPRLPLLLEQALRRFDACGLRVPPTALRSGNRGEMLSESDYQRLLASSRRVRVKSDPIAICGVPKDFWLDRVDSSPSALFATARQRLPRVYCDDSGLLAVREVSGAVDSHSPPKALVAPRAVPSGAHSPSIGVVMPIRDRPVAVLRASLEAWARQSLPPSEVVVVDQRSRTDLAEAYQALVRSWPEVRYLRCEQPLEWNKPKALNRGIRSTLPTSEYVLTTDCDLLFHPMALATMAELLAQGSCFLHGHRCDLPDLLEPLESIDESVWETWASAAKVVDAIADPWHLMPREWAFEVRGYDERMAGRGYMDLDLAARASRWLECRRLGPGRLVALHYPHARPDWFTETCSSEQTRMNREIFDQDFSVRRNDSDWGTCS